MRTLYCGGSFNFDYQQADYRTQAASDYRAILLGSPDRLLHRSNRVMLNAEVAYIGPFYFESDSMADRDIVQSEIDMVRACTDAMFFLDEAGCPGTICELTMASMLGKRVHLFYIRKSDDQETESDLHTPCWYPILHSSSINSNTHIYECRSKADAVNKIRTLIQSWQKQPSCDAI